MEDNDKLCIRKPLEVLTFFKKCLVEEKELGFNMGVWYSVDREGMENPYSSTAPLTISNPCGTSACLAGTVAFRVDSISRKHPTDVCYDYVMGCNDWRKKLPYYGTNDVTHMRSSLSRLFTSAGLYHKDRLVKITKADVIDLLSSLIHYINQDTKLLNNYKSLCEYQSIIVRRYL